MSLIICDDDCVYQKDGFCILETPTVINNNSNRTCVHYIKLNKNKATQENYQNTISSNLSI